MIHKLQKALSTYAANTAMVISGKSFTYQELENLVSAIRPVVRAVEDSLIAVETNNDLETYASIIALWFEGKGFIPLDSSIPVQRLENIRQQVGFSHLLSSEGNISLSDVQVLNTTNLSSRDELTEVVQTETEALAYIIFTSGSTGVPKGVPISYGKLNSLVNAHDEIGVGYSDESRVLQMFDLTFDLSIVSFLLPFLNGAAVYTIPKGQAKYLSVFQLLLNEQLTHALFVPSLLNFLLPLLNQKSLPDLRMIMFCGEALEEGKVLDLLKVARQAKVFNIYGPTESTIYCASYEYSTGATKSKNGVLSIGTPFGTTKILLLNERNEEVEKGEVGEICLFGEQIIRQYWDDANPDAFFEQEGVKVYKTGDLAIQDNDGLYFFMGRRDSQVKIGGYRVELAEIEHQLKVLVGGKNTLVYTDDSVVPGQSLLALVESEHVDEALIIEQLKESLPHYMVPTKIHVVSEFVYNANGKIDRGETVKSLIQTD